MESSIYRSLPLCFIVSRKKIKPFMTHIYQLTASVNHFDVIINTVHFFLAHRTPYIYYTSIAVTSTQTQYANVYTRFTLN